MSAHDRTLLANLGFADRDKKDPMHDLACQYIALPNVSNAIGLKNEIDLLVRDEERYGNFEFPISKGHGKYKTTIGFIDVILPFKEKRAEEAWHDEPPRWGKTGKFFWGDVAVCVEVKIGEVGLGEILRQINLYREYIEGDPPWVLAAAFEMSTQLAEGLRSHNITPVQLGEKFRKWAAEQHAAPRATNVPSL